MTSNPAQRRAVVATSRRALTRHASKPSTTYRCSRRASHFGHRQKACAPPRGRSQRSTSTSTGSASPMTSVIVSGRPSRATPLKGERAGGARTFGVSSTNLIAGLRGQILPKLPTIHVKWVFARCCRGQAAEGAGDAGDTETVEHGRVTR